MTLIEMIREFAREFRKDPLYKTGAWGAWHDGGAMSAETERDMFRALAYVKGYADACRLACEYMSPRWYIANLIGIAAGTFLCALEYPDASTAAAQERLCRMIETYRAELAAEVAKL